MIGHLVQLSVRFRVLLAAAAVGMVAMGAAQLRGAPVEALPEFTPPQVQIQTEALGLSAAEVEQLITLPIEHDLLNGTPWLAQIRSESVPGLSSIVLTFQPGTDPLKARQVVQERMTQAHALPNVGSSPVIVPPVASMSRVMMIGISSREISLIDLSVLARWKIKPRLMGVPGVANVTIWGQRDKQLQVQVDPERLHANGITLTQVISTTGNALWSSPLTFVEASTPGTGGFIDTATQRLGIQHVSPITSPQALASVTIEDTETRKLRLDQVASVVEGHQPLIGDAVYSRGPVLLLVVEKFPGSDTRAVTEGVEEALDALRPGLTGVAIDPDVYQARDLVDTLLDTAGNWAVAGLVGLLLVLGFGLFSWRLVVIALTAVFASVAAGLYALYLARVGFNLMVLGGLAVAAGLIVNDALPDLEGLRKRLQPAGQAGEAPGTVALQQDLLPRRVPQLHATVVVLALAVPFLFLGGIAGAFATPAVFGFAAAVVASTVVALVLTPALAAILLRGAPEPRRVSPLTRLADAAFARGGRWYVERAGWAAGTFLVLAALSAVGLAQLGGGPHLPQMEDRSLLVHWDGAPGTSLPEMERVTQSVLGDLRAVPGVNHAGAHLGRAITSDQVVNVNSGELWVTIADDADRNTVLAAVRRVVDRYPRMHATIGGYPDDRLRSVLSGVSDPVVVRVYGPDLGVLRAKAEEVQRRLATVPGVVAPQVEAVSEEPVLTVRVDLDRAQAYGVNPGDVRRTAATYYSGLLAGNLYQEDKIFDVVVVGAPYLQRDPRTLADLPIDTPTGGTVRLGDVANVTLAPNPTVIRHDATLRSVAITARVSGRDLGSVLSDVNGKLRGLPMPLEYHAEVVGTVQERQRELARAGWLAAGVAVVSLLLLQGALGSWRLAGLVALASGVSGAGSVLAALPAGGMASMGPLLGLLAVTGIAIRNNVVLVSGFRRTDVGPDREAAADAVLGVTREHAPTVLTGNLASAAVFAPLLFLGANSGVDMLQSLAAAVIAGLVTSTLVTLGVIPALYVWMLAGLRAGRTAPASQATEASA